MPKRGIRPNEAVAKRRVPNLKNLVTQHLILCFKGCITGPGRARWVPKGSRPRSWKKERRKKNYSRYKKSRTFKLFRLKNKIFKNIERVSEKTFHNKYNAVFENLLQFSVVKL
jgi:iron only hydrogenase large subunit-like protein